MSSTRRLLAAYLTATVLFSSVTLAFEWASPIDTHIRGFALTGAIVSFIAATDMLPEILRLPVAERAKLALELLRSLDGEPESGAGRSLA